MSTYLKDKVDKIEEVIARLADESLKGALIVVEGRKDAQTLWELGATGVVVTVKTGGKSFLKAVAEIERLNSHRVILLLDFDRRGREGTKQLQQCLERLHIGVTTVFWRELMALTRRDIQSIESLLSYLCTLRQKKSY